MKLIFCKSRREAEHIDDNEKPSSKDPIQNAMGELGWWQFFVCALVSPLKIPVAWHQLVIIFLAPKTDFTCVDSSLDKCDANCYEHLFNTSIFKNTLQQEFDLVCDRKSLTSLSQTIFMFGILVGCIAFGALSDNIGRRIPLVITVNLQLIFGVVSSYATNFWVFVFLRFVTAAATGGTMVVSFVLVMEIIGIKWRELFSVLYHIPFSFGHLTLPLFAYYIRDWHRLQFALSIPSVLFISYFWLLPESPRWLFTVNKVDKSIEVLEKAARFNNLPTENIRKDLEAVKASSNDEQKAKGNILDLFRTRNMLVKTICMNFNWFACGMGLFGVSQYVGESGGNVFKNVALSALFQIPGTLICIPLLKYWGRKKTLIMANCLTGCAMLTIAFMDKNKSGLAVFLPNIAITGICISFSTVYLYGGELFPTVIRNVAIGTASMFSRVGSMIAPFIATQLAVEAHWLPPVVFGVFPIIGAFLVFFLPETRGQSLPETIEDSENFGKKEQKKHDMQLNEIKG